MGACGSALSDDGQAAPHSLPSSSGVPRPHRQKVGHESDKDQQARGWRARQAADERSVSRGSDVYSSSSLARASDAVMRMQQEGPAAITESASTSSSMDRYGRKNAGAQQMSTYQMQLQQQLYAHMHAPAPSAHQQHHQQTHSCAQVSSRTVLPSASSNMHAAGVAPRIMSSTEQSVTSASVHTSAVQVQSSKPSQPVSSAARTTASVPISAALHAQNQLHLLLMQAQALVASSAPTVPAVATAPLAPCVVEPQDCTEVEEYYDENNEEYQEYVRRWEEQKEAETRRLAARAAPGPASSPEPTLDHPVDETHQSGARSLFFGLAESQKNGAFSFVLPSLSSSSSSQHPSSPLASSSEVDVLTPRALSPLVSASTPRRHVAQSSLLSFMAELVEENRVLQAEAEATAMRAAQQSAAYLAALQSTARKVSAAGAGAPATTPKQRNSCSQQQMHNQHANQSMQVSVAQ